MRLVLSAETKIELKQEEKKVSEFLKLNSDTFLLFYFFQH